ncbi:MAG: response regulator [Spirochaetes bacterium]|nr:response regulator [Spirochaetota bacterium]
MGKMIMAVDDSASIRQMVSFTLKEAGYTTIEADDGSEALDKIKSNDIDMLITDLNMADVDGIELISKVRAMPKYKFVPIIMLTTESEEAKKMKGKAVGATGWIVKPFQPDQLLAVIKKLLGE